MKGKHCRKHWNLKKQNIIHNVAWAASSLSFGASQHLEVDPGRTYLYSSQKLYIDFVLRSSPSWSPPDAWEGQCLWHSTPGLVSFFTMDPCFQRYSRWYFRCRCRCGWCQWLSSVRRCCVWQLIVFGKGLTQYDSRVYTSFYFSPDPRGLGQWLDIWHNC